MVAHLAPTLGEAELRVLLELTRLYAGTPENCGRISARDLADQTKVSRSNVQKALAGLSKKYLIATRAGTATLPALHILTFTRATQMGGPATGPPPTLKSENTAEEVALHQGQGGPFSGPQAQLFPPEVALSQGQGGPISGPPPIQGMRAPAPASIDSITTDLIDRLLKARPKDFDPGEIEQVRRWVHGYQCKRGRDKNPHPPDETILAQLLSLAPATRICRLIQELEGDRKEPGGQYAWYVTVALQRIHGIQPATLKAKRAELRIAPTRQKVIRGEQQQLPAPPEEAAEAKPDPQFARDLIDEIRQRKAKA